MQFALDHERFFMGQSLSYEIGVYTAQGQLTGLIRRAYDPIPVTAERQAVFREGYAEVIQAEEGNLSAEQLERALTFIDDADYPDHFPVYSAIRVDRSGNLWVEDYRAFTEPQSRWSVFDPDGRWLTTVRMPDGLQVLDIGDDYVLGFMRDDVGLDRVALFGLHK